MTTINWDDLAARLRLAEQVGLHRYNELYLEHRRRSVIATVGVVWRGRLRRQIERVFVAYPGELLPTGLFMAWV
jgi:hypothetical protein